ncbi:hypothetical protein [Ensifer aridi]|uniref:hypothetical protein n=1 Tax=Ensifer aridi TaxID=1708715 RepID=UPI00047DD57B|nr:hypothetical protein [Ensifer aridi]
MRITAIILCVGAIGAGVFTFKDALDSRPLKQNVHLSLYRHYKSEPEPTVRALESAMYRCIPGMSKYQGAKEASHVIPRIILKKLELNETIRDAEEARSQLATWTSDNFKELLSSISVRKRDDVLSILELVTRKSDVRACISRTALTSAGWAS